MLYEWLLWQPWIQVTIFSKFPPFPFFFLSRQDGDGKTGLKEPICVITVAIFIFYIVHGNNPEPPPQKKKNRRKKNITSTTININKQRVAGLFIHTGPIRE